jgi:hypothetical protein
MTAARGKKGGEEPPEGPPGRLAEGPPSYQGSDYSFTLQGVFDLKGSVAKLEEAVDHLEESVSDQKGELKTIQRMLWVATGVFLAISTAAGIFGTKIWDMMVRINAYMQTHP